MINMGKPVRYSNHAIQRRFERDISEKQIEHAMRMTFDKDVDAAYIYLKDKIGKGEVKNTIALNDDIILDFDTDKKLIGIEILSASKVISQKVVAEISKTSSSKR